MSDLVAVTGATGLVGRRVAELLSERGRSVRLVARDVSRAPGFPGAEVVAADFAQPETMRSAFAGASSAVVLAVGGSDGARARMHADAFEAAEAAGVDHIVYLSFQGAAAPGDGALARAHLESEAALAATHVRATVLRANLFLDDLPQRFEPALERDGVARGPAGRGAAAFVARDDVAAAIVGALEAEPGGARPWHLTGPEALTYVQVAQRLSALTGIDLTFEDEPVDVTRVRLERSGIPAWRVEDEICRDLTMAAGALEEVGDAVERFVGRPPIDLETHVRSDPQALAHLRPESAG
ncbi:MAG: NAD(P)H-binding protein [Trueperaceae bacterium]|nr:NAD(P)H-binding protein [Trueperaceae bacterium]